MKKRSLIAVVLTLGILLAGCGSKASSGSDKDYVQILQDARTDEFNESYAILSNGENGFEVTGGNSEEMEHMFILPYAWKKSILFLNVL